MSQNSDHDLSWIRNQWARQNAIQGVKDVWNNIIKRSPPEFPSQGIGHLHHNDPLPEAPSQGALGVSPSAQSGVKVGIIGAGAAGLFTGLIFDFLNRELGEHGFEISYDILEAGTEDRVGGRLYTYYFSDKPHDYYDVGAMRFPENPMMKRTFALFKTLGMEKHEKLTPLLPNGSIIPYYMKNGADNAFEPWCYNDITKWGNYDQILSQAANSDPFCVNTEQSIKLELLKYSPDEIMSATIEQFRQKLEEDPHEGWTLLMKYDTCSTRQFLSMESPLPLPPSQTPQPPYNYQTIDWLETFNGGSTWYDQAHSETVLESLDFEYDKNTKWYCILGGAQQLAKRMEASLQKMPTYECPVTAIRVMGTMRMEVDFKNGTETKTNTYAGVFNSTALGCLKRIDTSKAGLNYATKQAIRSLGYGPAAKVGIKFKRAWWIHDLGRKNVKKGGLGHSDLTIRTCVYPSYNIYDPPTEPAVLLCSYTWQQDALRIGALMSNNPNHKQKVKDEADLKELLFRDLARLHKSNDMSEEELYRLISDSYIDHHAYDWYHDPNTAGAFAFFRPQQYSNMWNKMVQPSGDLVIIGEAASPHHVWVVGALESAVHGVHAWLGLNRTAMRGADKAIELLESTDENNPFVGLPPYMDANTSYWHSLLARYTRDEALSHQGHPPHHDQTHRTDPNLSLRNGDMRH